MNCLRSTVAAILADVWIESDPKHDWIRVLILGSGAAITAATLQRPGARLVLIYIAMITLFMGIAMGPFTPALKGVLIAAGVLGYGFYAWRKSATPVKTSQAKAKPDNRTILEQVCAK